MATHNEGGQRTGRKDRSNYFQVPQATYVKAVAPRVHSAVSLGSADTLFTRSASWSCPSYYHGREADYPTPVHRSSSSGIPLAASAPAPAHRIPYKRISPVEGKWCGTNSVYAIWRPPQTQSNPTCGNKELPLSPWGPAPPCALQTGELKQQVSLRAS